MTEWKVNGMQELSEDQLMDVNGGWISAVVGAVVGGVSAWIITESNF